MRPTLLLRDPPPEKRRAQPESSALAIELSYESWTQVQSLIAPLRSLSQSLELPIAALVFETPSTSRFADSVAPQAADLIRLAAQLKADQVLVSPAFWWSLADLPTSHHERLERVAAGLRACQSLAEDWAVDVVLDLTQTDFLTAPGEAAAFVDDLAAAPFGLAIDCAAPPGEQDPIDWLQTLAHRVRSVRGVTDHPQADRLLKLLSETNYAGLLLVETPPAANNRPPQDVLKDAP